MGRPVLAFSDDPAFIAVKGPQRAVAGCLLDEVLVAARSRERQHALELPIIHLPSHCPSVARFPTVRVATVYVLTIFGDLLRGDRERNGLTVEQAARRLGVPLVAYGKLEIGEQWPCWETYDRIAAAFGDPAR
jgi:DNA-binding XRE family transcriptional regulator